jgi:alkaline phosphatase
MRFKKDLSKSIIFAIIAISIFMVYVSNGNSANLGPRNIIIMISDGCGYNQIDAASIYQHGKSGAQIYHQFPIKFGVSTFESSGSYDPNKAWSQFGYVQGGYTDSSAAATAMSTGFKTYNAAVGVNPDRKPLKHLLQRAKEMGKAAGVITSVEISHATPAGFVAHNESRNNYEKIAQEMILDSKADVIMGCGNPMFNDNSLPAQNTYMYIGGKVVWDGLLNGIIGYDLNGDGTVDNMVEDVDGDNAPDAWTLIQELSMFKQLMTGPTPKRVIGIAQANTTLQQARSTSDFNKNVPTLVEMSKAALNVLDNNPKGLFLMIEGGAIDWAAHSNQSLRMIEEEIDFSNAVQSVVDWVESNSNWNETLVIVTGDHETGYLTGPDSGPGPDWKPLVNNGAGKLPGMKWNSGNHTNSLLPLFAKGAGSNVFTKYADNVDPVRGAYIDNIEIAQAVFELMDLPVANVDVVSVGSQGKKATTLGKVKYDSLQSALLQNYPNPFNPETWIPFQLEEDAEVKMLIYNTIGELIRKIELGKKSTGIYISQDRAVYWDGKNEVGEQVTSGIYFYTIDAGKYTATGKMLMLK